MSLLHQLRVFEKVSSDMRLQGPGVAKLSSFRIGSAVLRKDAPLYMYRGGPDFCDDVGRPGRTKSQQTMFTSPSAAQLRRSDQTHLGPCSLDPDLHNSLPSVNPPSIRPSSDSDLAFRKFLIFCINYREHKNLIR